MCFVMTNTYLSWQKRYLWQLRATIKSHLFADLVALKAVHGLIVHLLLVQDFEGTPKVVHLLKTLAASQPLPRSQVERTGHFMLWEMTTARCVKIHDSRLLHYLIKEIRTWLNINHITVHNITYSIYILKLKEYLLKIQNLHNKQTSNLRNLHTHTHTLTALMFEQIYLNRNATDCRTKFCTWFTSAKSSTGWKKLIMLSEDMAVMVVNGSLSANSI